MASINRVTLIGNLGADPERSNTQSGQAYTKLRLATNENYQDRNGNWQSSTEWHTVKIWGASADRAAQQLRKGSLVYIEGSLKSYEIGEGNAGMGQGGNRTRIWEIKALAWRSLDSKESRNQGDFNSNQSGRGNHNQNQSGQSASSGGGFGNSGGGFGNSGGGFGNSSSGGGFGNSGGGFGNSNSGGGFGNSTSGGGFGGNNASQAAASSDWSTNQSNNTTEKPWGATPSADQGQANSSAWNNSGWGTGPKADDNSSGSGGSSDDPIPF